MDTLTGKNKASTKSARTGTKAVAKKKEDKKEEAKAVVAAPAEAQNLAGEAYRVLVAPLHTEKSSRLAAEGKYAFVVAPYATKVDVARAVRDVYGVTPTSVRVLNVMGKVVRVGQRFGKQKDVKKAIVTLKKGETIAISA